MNMTYEITCPVCFTHLTDSAEVCPNEDCKFKLPKNYYQNCCEAPPLPIAAVGYSQHGKTHLLAAIVLTLLDLASRGMSEPVTLDVIDDRTRQVLSEWINSAKRHMALRPTELRTERPVPMILRVSGLFPARTLLVYDVAGESFHTMEEPDERLPALQNIQIVWFVISPFDLLKPPADEVNKQKEESPQNLTFLFSSYKAAMNKLGAKLDGRNAVIVVAKGDKLNDAMEIHDYLERDPFQRNAHEPSDHFSIKSYEETLRQTGPKVQDSISATNDLRNMVNLLREERMEVCFCVTSALGSDATSTMDDQPKTNAQWLRQRVLDPLIWTLLLEKQHATAQAHVIVDPYIDAGLGYPACTDGSVLELLWKKLPRHHRLRTLLLGRRSAFSSASHVPPALPARSRRLHLIGPLLNPLSSTESPTGRVVLITNNIVGDLDDFKSTAWSRQLLLVTTSAQAEVRGQWPKTVVVQGAEDVSEIAEFLSKNV